MQSKPPANVAPAPSGQGDCIRTLLNEHAALTSMLKSVLLMLERGPRDEPERFFDVLRAMLFYIDEFPEKLHHPKESNFLFPMVARHAPKLLPTIQKLEQDHLQGEMLIRTLQQHLVAWEMLGESRKNNFVVAAEQYVSFYLEHMRLEETIVLPAATTLLTPADWKELDAAFGPTLDSFAGASLDAVYHRMFTKIVTNAPAPIGVGNS